MARGQCGNLMQKSDGLGGRPFAVLQCLLPEGHLEDHRFCEDCVVECSLPGYSAAMTGVSAQAGRCISCGEPWPTVGDWCHACAPRPKKTGLNAVEMEHRFLKDYPMEWAPTPKLMRVGASDLSFNAPTPAGVPNKTDPLHIDTARWLFEGVERLMKQGGAIIEQSQFEKRIETLLAIERGYEAEHAEVLNRIHAAEDARRLAAAINAPLTAEQTMRYGKTKIVTCPHVPAHTGYLLTGGAEWRCAQCDHEKHLAAAAKALAISATPSMQPKITIDTSEAKPGDSFTVNGTKFTATADTEPGCGRIWQLERVPDKYELVRGAAESQAKPTVAGRMAMLDEMIAEGGIFTPGDYLEVLETGIIPKRDLGLMRRLLEEPGPGIKAWPKNEPLSHLDVDLLCDDE